MPRMVLLAHQDMAMPNTDAKAGPLATLAPGPPKTASLDSGHSPLRRGLALANSRRANSNDSSSSGGSSNSFDDAPFIVSGPLLPIRQARRGLHQNRNFRIIGTQSAPVADVHNQASRKPEPAAGAAPPTPVSALASTSASTSTAGSSTSQSSNTSERVAGMGSRSSKSTITSTSPDIMPAFSQAGSPEAGRGERIREYDKHHICEVHELSMDPIVLAGHHSTTSFTPGPRMARSHGQAHGTDAEGRTSAVLVSSLLPGARTSPAPAPRAYHDRYMSPPGSTVAPEGGMVTQRYLVQRVPNESGTPELPSLSASQIRLASPQIRLHHRQHNSQTPSLDTLEERPSQAAKAVADGDTPAYFADTEMDGRCSTASADGAGAGAGTPADTPPTSDGRVDATRLAARQSWNVSSDDGAKTARRVTDRQRKRRGVRASTATETFHVRPVSLQEEDSIRSASLAESPVDVKYFSSSPILAALSGKGLHPGLAELHYAASSADEHPLPSPDHVRFPDQDYAGIGRELGHVLTQAELPSVPRLDHRATSFDLGHIGSANDRAAGPSDARRTVTRRASSNRGSGDRPGVLARAKSAQVEFEEGYDGDSEGLVRTGLRVPVHRRNTVAGEKMDEEGMVPGQRPARQRMPRNTSDFSDLSLSKEDRRPVRGVRRRPTSQSLLPIGTQISPGHANYVLMYNMLTGIRVSVSRCEAKDARPVRADDYEAMHKYSFDVVGDEMTSSSRYDFKFKDYAPWVFRCIREAFHLSTEDYLMSLTDKYILSEVGSSGKSGSFFYYSQDYRFIIKTVHHTEHKFMRQILPQYYEFVRDNTHTLLSRIYGLHRIKLPQGRKVHFIVMSNILPPNKDIHAQFDLKGSMQGRELSAELASKPRACLKDKNWVKMDQRLHLGPTKRHEFVKQLIEDVTLLIRLNIMDYSLLVGIHDLNKGNAAKLRDTTLAMFDPRTTDVQQLNRLTRAHTIRKKVVHTDPVGLDALPLGTLPPLPESMFPELRYSVFYREDGGILSSDRNDNPAQLIYYLGVIDILTPYNAVKRTEHVVKSIVHDGSQISAVNPRKYGLRFLRFMIRSLDGYEDVLPMLDDFERTTYQEICREHRLLAF